jgi:hypothetical protein
MTTDPLPIQVRVRLESALAESDLPFKVDVLYWDETSDTFHRLIEEAWEVVQEGPR